MEERDLKLPSGFVALAGVLLCLGVLIFATTAAVLANWPGMLWLIIPGFLVWIVSLFGFIINGPNQARVIQLFGKYVGTVKDVGFFYGNPFYYKRRVSLRIRTLETGVSSSEEVKDVAGRVLRPASESRQPLKVNDKEGTPIEISAVVVWKVTNAAKAVFQVDDYEKFVHIQADPALRNLASRYSYDAPEGDQHSLRAHIEEVAAQLQRE